MKGKLVNCSDSNNSQQCFVIADGGSRGYFVSAKKSDLHLVDGACISFDIEDQKGEPVATHIHILN